MNSAKRPNHLKFNFIMLAIFLCSFYHQSSAQEVVDDAIELAELTDIPKTKVLIVGTFHFDQEQKYDELSEENQKELEKITKSLAVFNPTKVVVEKDPSLSERYNRGYHKLLDGKLSLDTMRNEIFQLGFRMAQYMNHDSIYLFDNKPDYIGSLKDFTFEKMLAYADEYDSAFNKVHFDKINKVFTQNQNTLNSLPLYQNLKMRNSLQMEKYNTYRMHMIEMRMGINDSWMGPDWLGRWYQRNIRMMTHIMKFMTAEDRIIVFVGDNHKWVLEQLMNNTPEFEVVSSFDYF